MYFSSYMCVERVRKSLCVTKKRNYLPFTNFKGIGRKEDLAFFVHVVGVGEYLQSVNICTYLTQIMPGDLLNKYHLDLSYFCKYLWNYLKRNTKHLKESCRSGSGRYFPFKHLLKNVRSWKHSCEHDFGH